MNPMKYIQMAVLAAALAGMAAIPILWKMNKNLRAANVALEVQIEVTKDNMVLLTDLLNLEVETREAAQDALSELAREVPDVVYSQELPPSIQNVLDNFHAAIGR